MLQPPIDAEADATANGGRRPTVVVVPAPRHLPELFLTGQDAVQFTARDGARASSLRPIARGRDPVASVPFCVSEGVYSSSLTEWRKQRPTPERSRLHSRPPGAARRPLKPTRWQPRLALAQRDNARLTLRLKRAEAIIEQRKKSCRAAGHPTERRNGDEP